MNEDEKAAFAEIAANMGNTAADTVFLHMLAQFVARVKALKLTAHPDHVETVRATGEWMLVELAMVTWHIELTQAAIMVKTNIEHMRNALRSK